MLGADDHPEPEWFNMESFRKSGRYIGPEATKPKAVLAELDMDRRPSPSEHICTEHEWQLVVRGQGLLVVSVNGVRLLRETELGAAVVGSFGIPWK